MHKRDFNVALIAMAITIAVFGGSYAAKELLQSGAHVTTASDRFGLLQARAKANPAKNVVPFLGPFKKGNCSKGVFQMEAALRRVHMRKGKAYRCFGKATRLQVMRFQRSIHYKPTGIYTYATHRALVKRHGYSNDARRALIYQARIAVSVKQRATVRRVAFHLYRVGQYNQSYTQSGQRAIFPPWPRIPSATDCSGEVTWIAYQSGFGPAVGYYGPGSTVGWTGTLLAQGRILKPGQKLLAGDLVFYPGHVAMYIGNGQEISHGHTGVQIRPLGNYNEIRRYFQ